MDLLIDVNPQLLSILLFLSLIVVLGGIWWLILNKRYPKITFLVFEGNRTFKLGQRLIGDRIVEDSIIAILLNGNKLIGEDIKTFDYVYSDNNIMGVFKAPASRLYLATYRNRILIPLAKTEKSLELAPLATAKDIAIRYVNLIDNTEKQLDKSNPLLISLISAIPNVLPVLFGGLIMYLMLSNISQDFKQITTVQEASTATLAHILDELTGGTISVNPPPNGSIYNSTSVNPNLPKVGA